jgi:hypothetical protein
LLAIPFQQFSFNNPSAILSPSTILFPSAIYFAPSATSLQQFPFIQDDFPLKQPKAKKALHPPSASHLYPVVNKQVEQHFLGRGVTL